MIDTDEFILEHFGIKGMKWGVRNAPEGASASEKAKVERHRSNVKKASIILGSAAVAGALVVGGVYAKKHFNVKMSDIPRPKAHVKKMAESLAKEPVDMIHVSRGRMVGYSFLRNGGMKDAVTEMDAAGFGQGRAAGWFKRYGKDGEKVAAVFADPLGRKDHAGRMVLHDIVLPKEMAKNVNNADEVRDLVWPNIKDLFSAFYNSHPEDYGPGF